MADNIDAGQVVDDSQQQNTAQDLFQDGSDVNLDDALSNTSNDDGGGDATPSTDDQQQAQPKEAPVAMTKEAIQELLKSVAPQQQVQTQNEPQMTPEEFRRIMNVYEANEQIVNQLGLKPEAVPVLNAILQGIARQSVTMSAHQMRMQMQQMMQQIAPMQQMMREQQEASYRQEFYTANKDLKGYEMVAEAVFAQLKSENFSGSKDDVFKEIAKRTRAIKAKLSGGQQQQGAPRKQAPTLLRGGGQGGAIGGSSKNGSKVNPTAKSIFG